MNRAEIYINGLKQAYIAQGAQNSWQEFAAVFHGASREDIEKLQALYPDIPQSLLQLLQIVDGTYFRKYGDKEVCFYFLGSDVEEYTYPYYLLSAQEILANEEEAASYYEDYINREFEDVPVDEKITSCADKMRWLHFSDCVNNGGTSQLFIDFSPSEKGVNGQVVRFLHDPDEIIVIADSFDEYLQMLIDHGYGFINQDTVL